MRQLVVISEVADPSSTNPAVREKKRIEAVLREQGFSIIEIPANWPRYSDAVQTLRKVPHQPRPVPAMLNCFIHSDEEYTELYDALKAKNLVLLNAPEEYVRCHSFEHAYPYIHKLTPKTVVVHDVSEVEEAVNRLGLPVFIKGAVQSRKDRGWKACAATTLKEAESIVASLFGSYSFSEGTAIIRKLVPLRHVACQKDGFPIAREFRVVLYRHEILGLGYYWPVQDALQTLEEAERSVVNALAVKASIKLNVPFVVIDVAQLDNGTWTVIEPGDPQSAGLPNFDLPKCFTRLAEKISGERVK